MCCTLGPAELTNTIVYAGEAYHPSSDVRGVIYTHVMGYQNQAKNTSGRPNAMILPIPATASLGPSNFLDARACPDILKNMALQVLNTQATFSDSDERSIQVFRSGSYTVALADDTARIIEAIAALPADMRPVANREIFEAYARLYPRWKLAVCAWDGRIEAEPLLLWYEPLDRKTLFLPTLDAHDGHAPQLNTKVKRDHTLVVGSKINPFGMKVSFEVPLGPLGDFMSDHVWGWSFDGETLNGDYTIEVEKIRALKAYQNTHDLHARMDPATWKISPERYVPGS